MSDLETALKRIESAMLNDETPMSADLSEVAAFVLRAIPALNLCEDRRLVELSYCIGSDCIKANGTRLATWRYGGNFPICDECYTERLTDEERKKSRPILGSDAVRQLGLHALKQGTLPKDDQ